MKYTVKKNLLGQHEIRYKCPKCNDSLVSPIQEGGQSDQCPSCGTRFVVPGESEKEKYARPAPPPALSVPFEAAPPPPPTDFSRISELPTDGVLRELSSFVRPVLTDRSIYDAAAAEAVRGIEDDDAKAWRPIALVCVVIAIMLIVMVPALLLNVYCGTFVLLLAILPVVKALGVKDKPKSRKLRKDVYRMTFEQQTMDIQQRRLEVFGKSMSELDPSYRVFDIWGTGKVACGLDAIVVADASADRVVSIALAAIRRVDAAAKAQGTLSGSSATTVRAGGAVLGLQGLRTSSRIEEYWVVEIYTGHEALTYLQIVVGNEAVAKAMVSYIVLMMDRRRSEVLEP